MALLRAKKGEVPPDAIVLDKYEALCYQRKMLDTWKHPEDVLAYKYGGSLLGLTSGFVGGYINSHYRRKFKLRSLGKASSYLPIVIVPAAMSLMIHQTYILPSVVLQDTCPTCLEIRSALFQTVIGVGLPLLLGPISASALATQYATMNIPYITKEPMKVLSLWKQVTHPIANILFGIFLGQAMLAAAVTFMEGQNVRTVNWRLSVLENDIESSFLKS